MDQAINLTKKTWLYFLDALIGIAVIILACSSYQRIHSSTKSSSPASQLSQEVTLQIPDDQLHGIDVSHYQGNVDWALVAESFHFAFIKATEGNHYLDPGFHRNITDIQNTSLSFSAYHFYSPDKDPVEQANHFLEHTGAYDFTLPPVLDIEVAPHSDLNTFQDGIQQWLDIVSKSSGCTPIIYSSKSFWDKYLQSRFSDYPVWISDYTTDPERIASIPWSFWQFSDQGKVHGIDGPVDQSLYRGTEKNIRELGSCSA